MSIRTVRLDDDAEATLAALQKVFTIDRRDFDTYRIRCGHRCRNGVKRAVLVQHIFHKLFALRTGGWGQRQ